MLSIKCITFALVLASTVPSSSALWPLPQNLNAGSTILKLSNDFDIQLVDSKGSSWSAPDDLTAAVKQTSTYLKNDQLEALTPDYGASYSSGINKASSLKTLKVQLSQGGSTQSISQLAVQPLESRYEGYSINVPSDGSDATIVANTTLGLFRGLTTFSQLWFSLDGATYMTQAPLKADDAPAYKYRGFMLDTARN